MIRCCLFFLKIKTILRIKFAKKCEMKYGNPIYNQQSDIYELNPLNELDTSIKNKAAFYLIIGVSDEILYVGIDVNGRTRLRQHLIKNDNLNGKNSHTSSKIKEVYDYLIAQKDKPKKIYYKAIKIQSTDIRETVEHIMIAYYKKKGQCKWNKRT